MTDRIRRIVDPAQLQSLLRDGVGYVFTPVNHTVHVAGCRRAGRGASRSEPKFFAADDDSGLIYQERRLRDYPNAQPFRPARCCQTAIDARLCEVPTHAEPSMADEPTTATPARLTADRPSGKADGDPAVSPEGEWCLRGPGAEDAAVELWTIRRLPFTTDQTAGQKEMVGRVALAIRALPTSAPGKRVSGLFTSDDRASRQPEAENITFYNFGEEPFRGIPADALLRAQLRHRAGAADTTPTAAALLPPLGDRTRPRAVGDVGAGWRADRGVDRHRPPPTHGNSRLRVWAPASRAADTKGRAHGGRVLRPSCGHLRPRRRRLTRSKGRAAPRSSTSLRTGPRRVGSE